MGGQDKTLKDYKAKLTGSNFLNLGERELCHMKGAMPIKQQEATEESKAQENQTYTERVVLFGPQTDCILLRCSLCQGPPLLEGSFHL